jgi:transcriptional regulator with XRE-family HTH domain
VFDLFGENLKKFRNNKGLSQIKLSKLLNVSQQTVGSWEINRTSPDPEMIKKISEILDVSADKLLGLDKKTLTVNSDRIDTKVQSDNQEIDVDISKLTPENQNDLKKYYNLLKIKQKVDKNNNAKTSSSLSENA